MTSLYKINGTLVLGGRLALLLIAFTGAPACSRSDKSQDHPRSGGSNATSSSATTNGGAGSSHTNSSTGARQENPIDVNAMYGQPPMDAEETALAQRVKDAIAADPRITSKRIYVGVTHSWNGARRKDPAVTLAGSVGSEDEKAAAYNDVIKMQAEGWIVGNSLSVDRSQAPQSAQNGQSGQVLDPPAPWTEPAPSERPKLSLCPGFTVVTAIASGGDYESIKTVESMDGKQVRLRYSSESSRPWWEIPPGQRNCEAGTPGCAIANVITHRNILSSDLESAHKYDQIFVTDKISPDTAPGTTAIGTSGEVLRELKSKGESEFSICYGAEDTRVVEKRFDEPNGETRAVPAGCFAWGSPFPIKRTGNEPVRIRVLVDDAPVDLPAIQAQATEPSGRRDEFFFLDDEHNPLTLKFRLGIGTVPALSPSNRQACELAKQQGNLTLGGDNPPSCDLPEGGDRDVLTVTKIITKCEAPKSAGASGISDRVSALEKSLAENGKVDIYSIYFSFNSDKLRDESKPTLTDIAEVMRRHPDWKLQVNGHTDGIGGDEFNLDLSKRRAAAVKNALVKQFGVNMGRLAAAGYGKSQPKDTNDTLEGRARNRRVELMKIG